MQSLKKVEPNKARKLMNFYSPKILHFNKTKWDIPSEILYDPTYDPEFKFPLYFWCLQDKDYYYLGWAIYHRYDPAAMHAHDFEGALMRIAKKYHGKYSDRKLGKLPKYYAVREIYTISHLNIHFYSAPDSRPLRAFALNFDVEAAGHGISLGDQSLESEFPKGNFSVYQDFKIDRDQNLLGKQFQRDWKLYEDIFKPWVKLPDAWKDQTLEVYAKKRRPTICGHRSRTTKGLFFKRPDILSQLAKRINRFKTV